VANQAPIQAITQTAGDVYFAFSVVISPGQKDSINETADLKGKKIGYAVGSSAQSFLVKYLASADLTLDDVESVNLSTTQDMVAALSTNDIDALIALEPVGTMVVNSLDTKQLEYEQGLNYTVGVGVVNTDFAAANPDLVVRYLQIADKYNQQIESDPEEFKEIASQSLEVDAENLVTIDRFQFPLGFGKEAESALQETVDFLVDTGVLESEVDLTGTYTNKYADEVKRRGDE
jgi:ABC-type nitrate/sulfonate/bicarbonate transport system substrate-binding protein